jgi:hypothetical protein
MDVTPEQELETFITSLVFSLGGSSSPSLVHPGVKRILSDAGHEYINTLGKSARRASTTESENTQQEYKRRKVRGSRGDGGGKGSRGSRGSRGDRVGVEGVEGLAEDLRVV